VTAIQVVLAAAVSGVLSAALAYLALRRRTSGTVDTSLAEDLWRESSSIREHLAGRLEQIEKQMVANEDERRELRGELLVLHQIHDECTREITKMNAQLVLLHQELSERGRELATLKARLP
jgi:chromosome segregation ATPase